MIDVERLIASVLPGGHSCDPQQVADDIRAWFRADPFSTEVVAWEAITPVYVKYISERRYQLFSPAVRRWYKPYLCSSCATPATKDT